MTTRDPASIRVDAVIPVYNEEHVLARSVTTLHDFLGSRLPYDWRIVIADNASTDGTLAAAQALSEQYPRVAVVHLDQKGRGRALRKAWLESPAAIVSYMDVDLSTDLNAYPPMIRAIATGRADVATGRRLGKGARVEGRKLLREVTSRGYNMLIKLAFRTRFHDAQCGFKAISHEAADALIPLIKNNEWFFDTELLIVAEKKGYRIRQIPVHWVDDPDSRVNVRKTVLEDLRGLWRLKRSGY